MHHRFAFGSFLGLLLVFLVGCGTAATGPAVEISVARSPDLPSEVSENQAAKVSEAGTKAKPLRLEGSMIRTSGDDLVEEPVYDPIQLFFLARDAGRRRDYERAIKLYERLLKDFPDSRYVHDARFNIGLALELLERHEEAAQHFAKIADEESLIESGKYRFWVDAVLRWSVNLNHLEQWDAVLEVYQKLIDHPRVGRGDKFEASVGIGIVYHQQKKVEEAEKTLVEALKLSRMYSRTGGFDNRGLISEAAYRLGQISEDRYLSVELRLDSPTLREDFELKCERLLEAQKRYLDAVRHGEPYAMAMAGLRLGGLYENLYETLVSLEVPEGLGFDEAEVYVEEIRLRVNVLVKKALRIYGKALKVGRRDPDAKAWIAKLENGIRRLETIYVENVQILGDQSVAANATDP